MKISPRQLVLPLIVAAALAAGCNRTSTGDAKRPATQVAARVNSTEITVSQINNVLSRTPNVSPENSERVKRQILDRLIDAELAKEEAVTKKLDRSPAVVQQIEAAKTEVLARAYVDQFASQQPRPTPEEVKRYYTDHPELFTQRRVFNVEEIALPAQTGLAAKVRDQVQKSRSMTAVAGWLKSEGTQFTANSGVRFTEQIPAEYRDQMQSMKDGEIRVIENGPAVLVVHVVASKPAPVNEAQAAPRIQQYLFAERSQASLATDMKQLKEKAKIEYVGEFAANASEAQSKARAEADDKAKAAAQSKAEADAEQRAQADRISAARAAAAKEDAEAQQKAEEAARVRRLADAKARADEEAARRSSPQQPRPDLDKGVSGLIR